MHSYGGPVATDALVGLGTETRAAQGLTGGVSHLIYMASFVIPEGAAMIDKVKEAGHMDLMPIAFNFAEDGTCLSNDPKTLLVGESAVPDDEVEKYLATLVRWNGGVFHQPIKHTAWMDIPVGYIHCTADMTVPFEYQKGFVEALEKEGKVVQTFELATGHCPNLTATDGVVDAINKIVNV